MFWFILCMIIFVGCVLGLAYHYFKKDADSYSETCMTYMLKNGFVSGQKCIGPVGAGEGKQEYIKKYCMKCKYYCGK